MLKFILTGVAVAGLSAAIATPAAAQHQPTCRDFWICVDRCTGGDESQEGYCEGQCSTIFDPVMICKAPSKPKVHAVRLQRPKLRVTPIPAHTLEPSAAQASTGS